MFKDSYYVNSEVAVLGSVIFVGWQNQPPLSIPGLLSCCEDLPEVGNKISNNPR